MEADSTDYNDLQHHQRDMTLRDFRAEIGFLLALKEVHAPNINHIIDVFDVHDQLWIITEYCAGGSVRTLVSRNPLPNMTSWLSRVTCPIPDASSGRQTLAGAVCHCHYSGDGERSKGHT